MTTVIIFTPSGGGAVLLRPVVSSSDPPGFTYADALARALANDIPAGATNVTEIDDSTLPDAPIEAWSISGGLIVVDQGVVAQLAAATAFVTAIAAGVQIQSTGTPALNAVYSIDDSAQRNISGIAAGIASRNRLPGGGATFGYPDKAYLDSVGASGASHTFNATNFLNFAAAVEDYVYALSQGQSPTQPVTIA